MRRCHRDRHLRADAAATNTNEYGFFTGDNTVLTGTESQLAHVVQSDVFRGYVTVLGSLSYDTQIGGSTTVPALAIDAMKILGHND